MKRPIVGAVIAAATIIGLGGTAFAGEWGPGNGETPIKSRQECDQTGCTAPAGPAHSICAFNGRDQPDESALGEGDGEETFLDETKDPPEVVGDDADWGMTPAKGKVQAGGQFVAMVGSTFGPGAVAYAVHSDDPEMSFDGFGEECNPNSGFEE